MFNEPCIAVRDPLWKHIYIPEKLYKATTTPDFIRLSRIRQLGPTICVYPGATHTREAHSFGVYHIAMRILTTLLADGAAEWTTVKGQKSFAAAALFHDLGHFPFTHSLKELPLLDHEQLTGQIIMRDPIASIINDWGADADFTAKIVDTSIVVTDPEIIFFRGLLSGVLDPDKLDYLNRDAFFCGLSYGQQDIDYVLTVIHPDMQKGISIDSHGISSVENILFSKYLMYRAVYWHKNVRMATAMMKKTLFSALEKQIVLPEELYELDDEGIFKLLDSRASEHKEFEEIICAKELRTHQIYDTILEIPFNSHDENHVKLENLEQRASFEKFVAESIGCPQSHVIVDIPERISFEADLNICDLNIPFANSSTVFSQDTIKSFVSTLRKIRIGVHKDVKITKLSGIL